MVASIGYDLATDLAAMVKAYFTPPTPSLHEILRKNADTLWKRHGDCLSEVSELISHRGPQSIPTAQLAKKCREAVVLKGKLDGAKLQAQKSIEGLEINSNQLRKDHPETAPFFHFLKTVTNYSKALSLYVNHLSTTHLCVQSKTVPMTPKKIFLSSDFWMMVEKIYSLGTTLHIDGLLTENTKNRVFYGHIDTQPIVLKKVRDKEKFLKELSVLLSIPQSPYLSQLVYASFENQQFVFRREKSDLKDISAEDFKSHVVDILKGLCSLHSAGMAHNDVNPSNVVISPDGTIKLIDFEFTRCQKQKLMGHTPGFEAPEIACGGIPEANTKIDIWALGIFCIKVLTKELPFDDNLIDSCHFQSQAIIDTILKRLTIKKGDKLLYDIACACLRVDPKERPSAEELLHMHFSEDIST